MNLVPLGEVVEIKGGGTPSKRNPDFYNGDIPWVTPKDMKVWDISDSIDKITTEAIAKSATNIIPKDAILLVNRSGILKHTLPVGITRRPVAINQDLKALICSKRAHPEYIARLVKAAEPLVLKWVRATTADNFPIDNLKEMVIPLPPLEEQRRIAAILDQADALRRLRHRTLTHLNTLAQSIFHEMFGNLFPGPEDNGACSLQKGSGWVRCKLGEQITLQRGKDITQKEARPGNIPVISSGGISFFHDDAIMTGPGVILGRKGSVGKVHYSDVDYWPHDTTLYVKDFKGNTAIYIYYFFQQFPIAQYEASAANPSLNRNNLHPVEVFWPPTLLQEQFAGIIGQLDEQRSLCSSELSRSEDLFTSLQHRAFRGEL